MEKQYENINDFKRKTKKIVLISGKKRAGKDSFFNKLKELIGDKCVKTSFAKVLKENAYEDTKVLTDRINKLFNDFEKTFFTGWYGKLAYKMVGNPYELIKKELYITKEDFGDGDKNLVARSILEFYGTNIFRNRVDNDYWVKQTLNLIENELKDNDVVCIPDTRFENEIDSVKEKFGGLHDVHVIRINRPSLEDNNDHISNTALDEYKKFDETYSHDDLEELYKSAYDFWVKLTK